MALRIEPLVARHLGDVRRLFTMMTVERLTVVPYPLMDDEEIDCFILSTYRNLEHNPYAQGWVAMRGHKVVGFICFEIMHRAVGKPHQHATVHWMYVHPAHRHHGLANRLIMAGVQWVRDQGVTHAEFCAMPDDPQWSQHGVNIATVNHWITVDDSTRLFRSLNLVRSA